MRRAVSEFGWRHHIFELPWFSGWNPSRPSEYVPGFLAQADISARRESRQKRGKCGETQVHRDMILPQVMILSSAKLSTSQVIFRTMEETPVFKMLLVGDAGVGKVRSEASPIGFCPADVLMFKTTFIRRLPTREERRYNAVAAVEVYPLEFATV